MQDYLNSMHSTSCKYSFRKKIHTGSGRRSSWVREWTRVGKYIISGSRGSGGAVKP